MKVLEACGEAITNLEVANLLAADQLTLLSNDRTQDQLRRHLSNRCVLDYLKTSHPRNPSKIEACCEELIKRFQLLDGEILQIANSRPRNIQHLWLLLASGDGESFTTRFDESQLNEILEVVTQNLLIEPKIDENPVARGPE
eukprot:GHVN01000851.1.p1 GENE.GHVN01000851.1~~GHVN01000851.1.p1  ORF type:complete len:142 (+),score=19.65 GHVN01000851.1:582-1007(+)